MPIDDIQLKQLIEASLFVQAKTVSVKDLKDNLLANFNVSSLRIRQILTELQHDYIANGVQLVNVAGGYRFQTREELAPFLQVLWQEKAPKYSRATLETLAVIAYKQPVTRADVEQVRGVAVGSQIIKSMLERNWIKVIGHKEVPGRPVLYGTTPDFLDYFNLNSLADLPALIDSTALFTLFDAKEKPHLVIESDTSKDLSLVE